MTRHNPQEFLDDLSVRRGIQTGGYNPARFLELDGAEIVEPTAFEPDPNTHRGDYYYNAVSNVLYKKVISRKESGVITATWKRTST